MGTRGRRALTMGTKCRRALIRGTRGRRAWTTLGTWTEVLTHWQILTVGVWGSGIMEGGIGGSRWDS